MKPRPQRIYLDHNASTPLHPDVGAAMMRAFSELGNPSSIHFEGRRSRDCVESARAAVARGVESHSDRVIFTASGTEACCLGVLGLFKRQVAAGQPPRVWIDPTAHTAVMDSITGLRSEGAEVVFGRVDHGGHLDLSSLSKASEGGLALVAVSHVNHELGSVTQVEEVLSLSRAAGAALFVDAVQSFGKLPMGSLSGADGIALSAHKIYGPKGVGALVLGPGVDVEPIWPSGHQERGRRAGTENVVGVVGFGGACSRIIDGVLPGSEKASSLGKILLKGLVGLGARDHGVGPRLLSTVNVGFTGCEGGVLVQALDLVGISASTGSACTSGSVAPSAVLLATGIEPEQAKEAVRFSFGEGNTEEEVHRVLNELIPILERVRAH